MKPGGEVELSQALGSPSPDGGQSVPVVVSVLLLLHFTLQWGLCIAFCFWYLNIFDQVLFFVLIISYAYWP